MESKYVVEKGLRGVKPYYFEYKTPFKPRWANMTAKQVLCKELGQVDSVVDQSIDRGHIYITKNNGKTGGPVAIKFDMAKTHKLQPHDIIYNIQHMHEPSVIWETNSGNGDLDEEAGSLRLRVTGRFHAEVQNARMLKSGLCILFENEDVVVVSKPGGVATHPSGIYRLNTLTEIVRQELGQKVWPCHRLDKATLGVLVMAKTKGVCKKIMETIKDKEESIEKHYVARVKGKFHENYRYCCPVFTVNSASKGYINVPNAKQVSTGSTTIFQKVKYLAETDESIVKCQPISGKMHQIRVHLRNLGFPISNDPLYNPKTEVNRRKNGIEMKIYNKIFTRWPSLRYGNIEQVPLTIDVSSFILEEIRLDIDGLADLRKEFERQQETQTLTTGTSSLCNECGRQIFNNDPEEGIFLHSLRLKSLGDMNFDFATGYPKWCE
ncbi:CIC11C00000000491 [Sungouiella intermedia]|uniref:CIC11C00000000491 n=1 Tax=Sungouiella intermedia TaxID=45354 RepID=A0A1L0BBL6_9ASCO|nr:CIC11C00000000491 [[Candida] intermedia]